jgi:PTH1 family peptidyl-tRNA hydrolase
VYVIAGLGNPGREYRNARHNAGFMVVDKISESVGIKVRGFRYKGRTGKGGYQGEKLFLLKPRTYMNRSGASVGACLSGLKLSADSLIVVHDDMDLSPGRIRVKKSGGAGGHRGLGSLIDYLGTEEFTRIKIGIGRPPKDLDPVDYVLMPFLKEEKEIIKEAIERGARAALAAVVEGVDAAMNEFNKK